MKQITTHHGLDTSMHVFFYEQEFYVLSNFSAFAIDFDGHRFPTAEHLYHWKRFQEVYSYEAMCAGQEILVAKSAHEAFTLAQRNKVYQRPDWDNIKVNVMRQILMAKAIQHEYVRRKLVETGERELIENSWRDDFWGWGPAKDGKNMLGLLWMQVRNAFKEIPE